MRTTHPLVHQRRSTSGHVPGSYKRRPCAEKSTGFTSQNEGSMSHPVEMRCVESKSLAIKVENFYRLGFMFWPATSSEAAVIEISGFYS